MPRHLSTKSRGRQSQMATTRGPRAKAGLDNKYQQGKRRSGGGSKSINFTTKRKTNVKAASRTSDIESTASSSGFITDAEEEADNENDDEDVDEDEDEEGDTDAEPEVYAPSRSSRIPSGPGRFKYDESDDNLSDVGDWAGVSVVQFEGKNNTDLQRDEEFEKRLFDSDDDQIYEAVNEVSDSDDDPQALERAETELLLDEFEQLEQLDGEAARLINEIDGLSACGFGEDSDESMHFPLSPHASDDAAEIARRRVRFEENIAYQQAAMTSLSDSPTMTRALLPSALPETFMGLADEAQNNVGSDDAADDDDDGYDTDATDQLPIPSQAFQVNPGTSQAINREGSPSVVEISQRTPGDKPPPKGRFEDDGSKVTAILDPTGRKLLLSDPQGVFARRVGPSAPASPSVGFEEAVFGETDSSQASMSPRLENSHDFSGLEPVDLMLSGLNNGMHASSNGQATGLPEAFLAPLTQDQGSMLSTSALVSDFLRFPTEEPEDTELNLEDMITFGNETDDEDTSSRHIYMPDDLELLGSDSGLTHLNNMNVTAFRRNADPSFASQLSQPGSPMRYNQFSTPRMNRKRKADNDSPYNHNHYKGVTPVQRITDNPPPSSPISVPSKRRRFMTIS